MQENNKIVAYITETGGLISEHDYNFLSDGQKAKCKIYTPLPAPSSTPRSVEGILKKHFDKLIEGKPEENWYQWDDKEFAESRKTIYAAMQEYGNQLVGDKEREYKKLQKENDGIKKYVRDVCSENKKKYKDNTAILVILQQIEESITWINPTVKQQPIK